MKEYVTVYGKDGRKLGEIRAWTSMYDFLDKSRFTSGDMGQLVFESPVMGSNHDAITLWDWKQVLSCGDEKLEGKTYPFTCIVCGQKSISPERHLWTSKNKFTGIACKNKKCKVYNIFIPAGMVCANREDVPWDKLVWSMLDR